MALAVGCIGGLVGLLRPSPSPEVVVEPSADERIVPAPVAGVAELAVEEWLTATEAEREELAGLFVEEPFLPAGTPESEADDAPIVSRVTTVGGQRLEDGYWSVTVAADVVEPGTPPAGGGTDDTGDADEAVPDGRTRWFLEVGIVGDGNGGYVPLAAPAVMPAPPADTPDWGVGGSSVDLESDDPLVATIEQFLTALLTGEGEASRYLATGVEIPVADPPPFDDVTVEQITLEESGDDAETWVLVAVLATTPGGAQVPLTYDLVTVRRSDRWEILALSGFPTLID